VGGGDDAEGGSREPARADGKAERYAGRGARAAGKVVLAELDQDRERDADGDSRGQGRDQSDASAGTYAQRDQGRDGGRVWVVPPRRAVWLPAGVPHSHRARGRTQMLTLAFAARLNPLAATDPTVIAVGQLLREVIIALAQDQSLGPGDRADLYRVALRRLVPAPALQHHLPAPVDPRLRDVAAILADHPADERTLAELGRAAGASE
jgi:hypothetical protein